MGCICTIFFLNLKDNMRHFIVSVFVLVLVSLPLRLLAQVSSQGTHFFISYGTPPGGTLIQMIKIAVTDTTNVTLTFNNITGTGKTVNFSVPAGQVYSYSFSSAQVTAMTAIAAPTNTQFFSLEVTSSKPVSVYIMNSTNGQGDATLVMPIHALGTEYYVIGNTPSSGNNACEYIIVATENGTNVYQNNSSTPSHTLNAGQSALFVFPRNTDPTGMYITANKPVAFFSATSGGIQFGSGGTGSSTSPIYEQLMPITTWGTFFIVPVTSVGLFPITGPPATVTAKINEPVRVIASQPNTIVYYWNSTSSTQYTQVIANAGGYFDLPVVNNNTSYWIQATNPISVSTFFYNFPAMIEIPSTMQMVNSVLIAPFHNQYMPPFNHYAIVVAPTQNISTVRMAIGSNPPTPLSGGSWVTGAGGGFYSYYLLPVPSTTDAYTFSNPSGGVLVWIFGSSVSNGYYYIGGTGTAVLNIITAFYANGVSNLDMPSTIFTTHAINFMADITPILNIGTPGYLKWYIDGVEEIAARDKITWNKTIPNGAYEIKMVYTTNQLVVDSLVSTLIIVTPDSLSVCKGTTVNLNAGTYNNSSATTYQWQRNGIDISGATNSSYSYISMNDDTITCSVTINANTATPITAVLYRAFVSHYPTAVITNKTVTTCSGSTFTISPTNTGGDTVPANTRYTWTVTTPNSNIKGASNQANQNSISQTLYNLTNTAQVITYTVTPTTTGTNVCTGPTFTVTVTVNPKPTIVSKRITMCSGSTFTMMPINNPAGGDTIPTGTTYTWTVPPNSLGATNQSTPQTSISQTLTNTSNLPQGVTYSVAATSGTCIGSSFTLSITVNNFPTLTTEIIGHHAVCVGDTVQLFEATTGGVWTVCNANATINASNVNPVIVTGAAVGKTYVTYTMSNGDCEVNKTFLLKIVPSTPPEVKVGFEN